MNITEHQNRKIKLYKMKMNTNALIEGNENTPFPKYGFALLVCGAPGSGKSSLVFSQMTNTKGLFYRKFHNVFIFSPSLHTLEKTIQIPKEQIFETFDMEKLNEILEELKENKKNNLEEQSLIVFDDMLSEISKDNSSAFLKMMLNRRHMNLSIIMTTQVYNKIKAPIRKSFSNVILFNTKNKKELECIRDEITSFSRKEFNEITKYCFQESHDFIMFSMNNNNLFRNFNLLTIKEKSTANSSSESSNESTDTE